MVRIFCRQAHFAKGGLRGGVGVPVLAKPPRPRPELRNVAEGNCHGAPGVTDAVGGSIHCRSAKLIRAISVNLSRLWLRASINLVLDCWDEGRPVRPRYLAARSVLCRAAPRMVQWELSSPSWQPSTEDAVVGISGGRLNCRVFLDEPLLRWVVQRGASGATGDAT